ncbi:hypothetical protein FGIG_10297 [Fasciola gigantica]|uniref:Uncharacterized protein n=1 Tax=Fasciola gigantica TaxID=46835 RepID=A0A504YXI3_FASGI|nr:hypothetical protein FGIG_10297 [Fasciola gigantica]
MFLSSSLASAFEAINPQTLAPTDLSGSGFPDHSSVTTDGPSESLSSTSYSESVHKESVTEADQYRFSSDTVAASTPSNLYRTKLRREHLEQIRLEWACHPDNIVAHLSNHRRLGTPAVIRNHRRQKYLSLGLNNSDDQNSSFNIIVELFVSIQYWHLHGHFSDQKSPSALAVPICDHSQKVTVLLGSIDFTSYRSKYQSVLLAEPTEFGTHTSSYVLDSSTTSSTTITILTTSTDSSCYNPHYAAKRAYCKMVTDDSDIKPNLASGQRLPQQSDYSVSESTEGRSKSNRPSNPVAGAAVILAATAATIVAEPGSSDQLIPV